MNNKPPSEIEKAIGDFGLELITTISEDPYIADLEIKEAPLIDLPKDSPLQLRVKEVANLLQL